MKNIIKRFVIAIGIFAGTLLAVSIFGLFIQDIQKYLYEKRMERDQAALEKELADIKQAYSNDFDGGSTPEETFDLFIAALKAGDIVKASKYYELSVQPKALASLEDELKKNGDLHLSINYFTDVRTKGVKKCGDISKGGGCTFEYVYITTEDETVSIEGGDEKIFIPKGSEQSKITDIGPNKYTNVWKVEQPY